MPVVDGLPMTELRRQVSPRRAGSGPPEHSVEHLPVIGPPATTARREVGQQQRHPVPLGIGQIVTIEHIPCLPQPGYKIHGTGSRRAHTVLDVDPVRNPYAPGAGQRPPELAGRDDELSAFDVVLERIAHGRPERSLVLTGLRGVGKTVLLNQLRSAAIGRGWGTGKIEARPDQSLRRPVSSALHMALRELRHPDQESMDAVLGVLKAFALRQTSDGKVRDRWQPGIDVPTALGRADSGDMEIDLVELLTDAAGLAADVGKGVALFIDEMQDVQAD